MAKKAYRNYIKAVSNTVEHKKMYKAKKQWIVAGISFLAVMGLGAGVSNANASANAVKNQVTNPKNHKAKLTRKVTLKPAKKNNNDQVMKAARAKHARILANNKKRVQHLKKVLAKKAKQERAMKAKRAKQQAKLLKQQAHKNHDHKNLARKHHVAKHVNKKHGVRAKKHNVRKHARVRKHAKRRVHVAQKHNRKNRARAHKVHKVLRVRNHKAHKLNHRMAHRVNKLHRKANKLHRLHRANKPFAANTKRFKKGLSKLAKKHARLPSASNGGYYSDESQASDTSIAPQLTRQYYMYKQINHGTPYQWHERQVVNFDGTWVKRVNFYDGTTYIGSANVTFPQDSGQPEAPAQVPSNYKIASDNNPSDGTTNVDNTEYYPINTGYNNHVLAEDYNPETDTEQMDGHQYQSPWNYVNVQVKPIQENNVQPSVQPQSADNNIKYLYNGQEVGWATANGNLGDNISNVILDGAPNGYHISSDYSTISQDTIKPEPNTYTVNVAPNTPSKQTDNDHINYVYNGNNEGSTTMQGSDGSVGTASGAGITNPNEYKLANDGTQYFMYNNGTHNVNVVPTSQNDNVVVHYINNGQIIGQPQQFSGNSSDTALVGTNPEGLPSGYTVNNPNQVIHYNQGTAYVPVSQNNEQDTVHYTYNGQTLSTWSPKGPEGNNFTVDNNSQNVPQGYTVSSPQTFQYDGGEHDVQVQPNNVTDTFNFMDNGKQVGSTQYQGGYDSVYVTLGEEPNGLPSDYQLPADAAKAKYNLDGGTYNINVNKLPSQPSDNNRTDTFNYTYNGKPVGQTKYQGPSNDDVNLGDDPEGLQDGYKLPASDAETNYPLDGTTRNINVDAVSQPQQPAKQPSKPTPQPQRKTNFITDVNDLRNGQVGTYHGLQVQRINMSRNPEYRHFRWFKINRKGVWIHTDILSVGHHRNHVLFMRPDHGIFHRITRVFVLRFNNKIVGVRYEFRIGHMNYFVTANPDYTVNSYWQRSEMNNTGNHTLEVIRPCAEYTSKYFNHNTHRRTFRVGKRVHIKGIIDIGRRGDYQTRFILSNGHYITANKNYVSLVD